MIRRGFFFFTLALLLALPALPAGAQSAQRCFPETGHCIAGAIRAYRHYLALRSAPEPRLRAQADTVRIELAELLRAADRH